MPRVDWLVVRTAATAGLLVVVPSAILAAVFVGDDGADGWAFLFTFVTLLGFVIAGYGAGRLRSDTPMMHGALAALACYVIVQAFGTVRRLIADEPVNLATYPLTALMAATCGVFGAVTADWLLRRARRAASSS